MHYVWTKWNDLNQDRQQPVEEQDAAWYDALAVLEVYQKRRQDLPKECTQGAYFIYDIVLEQSFTKPLALQMILFYCQTVSGKPIKYDQKETKLY